MEILLLIIVIALGIALAPFILSIIGWLLLAALIIGILYGVCKILASVHECGMDNQPEFTGFVIVSIFTLIVASLVYQFAK